MRISTASRQSGQSLTEILITVLVVVVVVTALIRFQGYLSYQNASTKQQSDARLLAAKQLETFMDFQMLTNTTGYTSYQSIVSGSSNTTLNGTAYTVTWTVTSYSFPTYKNVNIAVSWTDRNGVLQSVTVNSDIAGIEPSFSALIM